MPTPDDVENWKDQEAEPADMAQAYRDLARGEQAAAAIEANLSRFEVHVQSLLDAVQAGMTSAPPYASTASLAAARPAADDKSKSKAHDDKSRGDKKPQNGRGGKQN